MRVLRVLGSDSRRGRVLRASVLLVGCFYLSVGAVVLRPEGTLVAVWWPAAALAIGVVLRAPAGERLALSGVVLASTAMANVVTGRPLTVAVAFALANAVEAWLAAWLFTRNTGGRPRYRSIEDVARLMAAGLAGAGAAAVLAALAAAVLMHQPPLLTLRSVAVAHGAAVVIAVPLFVLRTRVEVGSRRRAEALLAWLTTLVGTGLLFGPWQDLPLAFLIFPALVWAALRLGPRHTTGQLLVLALGTSFATVHGWGPFGPVADREPALGVTLAQLLNLTAAVVVHPLVMAVQNRHQALAELRVREQLFRLNFDEALVGMLVLQQREGGGLKVLRCNAAARHTLGARSALVGRRLEDFVDAADAAALEAGVRTVLGTDLGAWHGQLRVASPDSERWVELAMSRLPGVEGPPVVTAQLVDVSERHARQQHLREAALRDALTGLPNRRALLEQVAARTRDGGIHALLFCDLDGFKAVNDQAGHETGDRVLVEVAQRFAGLARSGDTVARLGGDEFVVFCPDVPGTEVAGDVAARLAAALERDVVVDGRTWRLGVSIGVALVDGPDDLDRALRTADEAMYEVKALRRAARLSPTGQATGQGAGPLS